MAVINQNPFVEYTIVSGQTEYEISFNFANRAGESLVVLVGETELVENTDYQIVGLPESQIEKTSYVIRLTTNQIAGRILRITRDTIIDQEISYVENLDLSNSEIVDSFDKTTRILQEVDDKVTRTVDNTNSIDIATNKTDIATNKDNIDTNTSNIATNTDNISANTTDITTNRRNISSNRTRISANKTAIDTNTSNIATNTSNIATNTSNIATNRDSINANRTDIDTNTASVSANRDSISTNTTRIATNRRNISTNTTGIATNTTNIAANTTGIATNKTAIDTNTTGIATNTTGIATNTTNIATNTTGIATNKTNIATNRDNINTNTTAITRNTSAIATNRRNISTNATGIATNRDNIADLNNEIDNLELGETNVQSDWDEGDSTNASFIKNKPNLSGIATNRRNISTNTSAIATNRDNIADLNNEINNLELSGGNVQSDWDETDSSDASFIKNKPDLSSINTSADLPDIETLPDADISSRLIKHLFRSEQIFVEKLTFIADGRDLKATNIPESSNIESIVYETRRQGFTIEFKTPPTSSPIYIDLIQGTYQTGLQIDSTLTVGNVYKTIGNFPFPEPFEVGDEIGIDVIYSDDSRELNKHTPTKMGIPQLLQVLGINDIQELVKYIKKHKGSGAYEIDNNIQIGLFPNSNNPQWKMYVGGTLLPRSTGWRQDSYLILKVPAEINISKVRIRFDDVFDEADHVYYQGNTFRELRKQGGFVYYLANIENGSDTISVGGDVKSISVERIDEDNADWVGNLSPAILSRLSSETNVQSDWDENDDSEASFIKNKPDIAANTTDIATNKTGIVANTTNIRTNTTDIAANKTGIVANTTDISTNRDNIRTNTTAITANTSAIAINRRNISTNATSIVTNRDNIADLDNKVDNLELGETNVQSDWNETNRRDASFIKNKPKINVQSDWDEGDSTDPSFIKNKPDLSNIKILAGDLLINTLFDGADDSDLISGISLSRSRRTWQSEPFAHPLLSDPIKYAPNWFLEWTIRIMSRRTQRGRVLAEFVFSNPTNTNLPDERTKTLSTINLPIAGSFHLASFKAGLNQGNNDILDYRQVALKLTWQAGSGNRGTDVPITFLPANDAGSVSTNLTCYLNPYIS